eukprot:m.27380 g.27380  ORF g.27380 m.27380 type:complete len:332 (-) comp7888_c0_seq3:155-1150(-)
MKSIMMAWFLVLASPQETFTHESMAWTPMTAPQACYRDVSMVSNTVGFAVAEEGIVVGTTDGKRWTTLLSSGGEYYWYGVHAFTATNVIITGFIDAGTQSLGVVRHTSDGGASWTNDTVVDSSAWLTSQIQFLNASHGFVMASLSCRGHATSDGGQTFTSVTMCDGWLSNRFEISSDGSMAAAGTSFCTASNATWPPVFRCSSSVDPDGDASPVHNGNKWIVAGGIIAPSVQGWVHLSTDNRGHWGPRTNLPYPIRDIFMLSDTNILAAGGDVEAGVGGIYMSTDGGNTFKEVLNSAIEHQAIVQQGNMLYSVGCGSGNKPGIYTTTVSHS